MSHDGCAGSFENGRQVVDKVREMGFSVQYLPVPLEIKCSCGNEFRMDTFESVCDKCGMVHGVTPCHAFDANNVKEAGVGY